MIYLAIIAALIAGVALAMRLRAEGARVALLNLLAAALIGWVAGLLIGVGARFGMWSIPFFNGQEWSFSAEGSLQVVLIFSTFGIGLGILYEFLFRRLLGGHGLLYGAVILAISGYPLAQAAIQQLTFSPNIVPAVLATALIVGLMFIPYALVLESLLRRWHARYNAKNGLGSTL